MSTNGDNVENADMAECDGEKVVTMMDVLQEEQDFEDNANAVLGGSDEKNCTYSQVKTNLWHYSFTIWRNYKQL